MSTHRALIGDNLDLLPTLAGQSFDLIYLDPPYNTGGKVVSEYADRFDDWSGFMAPRLDAMVPLLSELGVIIASIDDTEVHHLRVMLDDLMGPENHVGTVVWDGTPLNSSHLLSVSHDYLVIYARDLAALKASGVQWREPRPEAAEALGAAELAWERSGHDVEIAQREYRRWLSPHRKRLGRGITEYVRIDEAGRLYRVGDAGAPSAQAGRSFRELCHPVTSLPCPVPKFGWRFSDETMDVMLSEGRIEFGPDHTTIPKPKRFLADHVERTPKSVFRHDRSGTKHLERILGERRFPFPKDLAVMMHWIDMVAPADAAILDPFLGSGTTIEAVAALNAEDGGSRSCTGVTIDEGDLVDTVLVPRMEHVERALGDRVDVLRAPRDGDTAH